MPKAIARSIPAADHMRAGLLLTKLYVPPARPSTVARPRLVERLNTGLSTGSQLVLVSAPAGFGKTTLVGEWVAACVRREPKVRPAWLSLDEGDNDPTRFFTYLVAALQTVAPAIGAGMLSALHSPQPPPLESMLTDLVNEITTIHDDLIVVLDDYHVIQDRRIDDALAFLLDHLPHQMHLLIATREDPHLPLARFRARAQLTELRAVDLRFSRTETAEFLNLVMGLNLSAEHIAALEDRTEGWVAGLQLAALSMQGRQDVSGFVRAFSGDHRYILDYLVEEVLQRQPEPVRTFLLQTAILDRLNGALCDAVTGQTDGHARLETLERDNLFVVPLDGKREWYRYHHLFAQVLTAHMQAEQPNQLSTLHRRASEWYEQNGWAADAIHHALAAKDLQRAANLVERSVPAMRQSRQETAVLGWLKALPEASVRCRPVLGVAYAWALLASGELDDVEERLRDAERWLDPAADKKGMVVADDEEYRRLPAAIAVYRAVHAQVRGDVDNTVKYARRALTLVPEDDHLVRGAAAALLGLASWASGDLETAYQMYSEGMARVLKAGNIADAINGTIALADIQIAQGRLRDPMRTYERGLRLATEQGEPAPRGTADLHVGMSELYREQNDLLTAREHLRRSQELGEHTGFPQNRYRWRVALAGLQEAQGNLDGALDLLQEAERLYVSDFAPNMRPLAACKTRIWVAQGKVGQALAWAREQGLSAHDDLSYLREFEYITLARVLLAQSQSDRADHSLLETQELLERLLAAATAGGRRGSAIEILVLLALTHRAQGDVAAALAAAERALTLAEPEGFVRVFVDGGPAMAALLDKAAKQGIAPDYARQVLRAFGSADNRMPAKHVLVEPLSERELDVLKLLVTDLDGPEIAHSLMVSLNTLRTHTKNIYAKLGVNNRRSAVRRAEELALL